MNCWYMYQSTMLPLIAPVTTSLRTRDGMETKNISIIVVPANRPVQGSRDKFKSTYRTLDMGGEDWEGPWVGIPENGRVGSRYRWQTDETCGLMTIQITKAVTRDQ